MAEEISGSSSDEQAEDKPTKRMVSESDLIAAKNSLNKKLSEQKEFYEGVIAYMNSEKDEERSKLLKAEAKAESLAELTTQEQSASEELAKVKSALQAAEASRDAANQAAVEYRRKFVSREYGVSEDAIKDKNIEQLGYVEDALKLVQKTRSAYATGGGATSTPVTPLDRAKGVIEQAEKKQGLGQAS